MNVWFCSDLHFGHKNIEKFRKHVISEVDNREMIYSDWMQKVKKKDSVYVLGDAAFTIDTVELFGELPGTKHLIRGNHDLLDTQVYLKHFKNVFGILKYKEFWLSHVPIHPDELRGRVNLHGHVHYSSINDHRYFNCCVENIHQINGSSLISLDEIRKIINAYWAF